MITPIEPMAAVKLEGCPFCGEHLSADEDYYTHPENDCFLSRWEFDRPDPMQWNRRVHVEAPTSDPRALTEMDATGEAG